MIKRIIFDLDNTLIEWKSEYIFALENTLKELNINYSKDKIKEIDSVIDSYDKYGFTCQKKEFLDYVNKECNTNFFIDFVDKLIIEQGKCYQKDEKLVKLIEYLSKKYDLVLLSNWFTDTQKLRLKGVGIDKYFSIITGGDEHPLKPNLEAFDIILKDYKPEECLMVGDSLIADIIPAKKLGINTIWITKESSKEYKTIKEIYELEDIL